MKKFLFALLLPLSTALFGQSPFAVIASNTEGDVKTEAFAANTPWVGSRLAYNISGDVSESFLFSTGTFYPIAAGENFSIPVSTNIGFGQSDSLSTTQGVTLGVLPWYSIHNEDGLQIVLHGGAIYHVQNLVNASEGDRFKALFGIQAAFSKDGSAATVVSLTPAWVRALGGDNASNFGLEISAIVPVAQGLGILVESNVPFDDGIGTGLNFGVIVNFKP